MTELTDGKKRRRLRCYPRSPEAQREVTAQVPWKTPSEGRADFPGADINCTLFQRSPFLTQPPKQAHQILSSGGKIEFPGRKEEPEPGCCWESRRAGVPAQLPQAGGPNASICCTVTCLGTSSVARLLCCPVCCCKQLPSLPAPHQRGKSPGM